MHNLRFFSNAEVAERLAYPQLIEALRIGLAKPCSAPLRNCHALPAQASLLQMPVWQAGAGIGVKLVTVFPGNGARGLPAVAAVFALFDGEDGRPLALLEASELTARRTACSSALAADYLARDDARRLLVVGCGTLAAHMVRAHACVRDYRHIDIWGRDPAKAAALAARLREEGYPARAADGLRAAVEAADCVSCVTTSREALVRGAWLKPGVHLDLVGAFLPSMRETDALAVARAGRGGYPRRRAGRGRRPVAGDRRRRHRARGDIHRTARLAGRGRAARRSRGNHPVQVGGLCAGGPGRRAPGCG